MSTTPRPASPAWDDHAPDAEFDLLVQDPLPPAYVPQFPHQQDPDDFYEDNEYVDEYVDEPSVGTEYSTQPGLPARGVIVVSMTAALGCAALNFALAGGLTMFFDLCFIVVCLVGAMAVRRQDLFTTGVLAPLVFAGVIAIVAVISPSALSETGGFSKVFLTGLAAHAGGLVAGYGVALAAVASRVSAARPV